jgi:hypothetical protein
MSSGKTFGLLIVAVEGLISVEPGFVTISPDESYDATGPASSMVGGGRIDFLSLEVRLFVGCTKSGPPSKDELIPANRTWCSTNDSYLERGGNVLSTRL